MQNNQYSDLTPELRIRSLQDDAVETLNEKFYEPLTQSERESKTRTLLSKLEEMDSVSSEAAQVAKDYKETIKGLGSTAKTIRGELRSGVAEVDGKLYGIPDYNAGKMNYYSEAGIWIRSRNLLPEERQHRIEFGGARYAGGAGTSEDPAIFKVS